MVRGTSTEKQSRREKFSDLIRTFVMMHKSAHPAEWYTKDEFRLKFHVGMNRAKELGGEIVRRNLPHRLTGPNGRQVVAPLQSWFDALETNTSNDLAV